MDGDGACCCGRTRHARLRSANGPAVLEEAEATKALCGCVRIVCMHMCHI